MSNYKPSQEILKKYADVLVNFALGGGKGVRKGEVVRITAGEYAKPLYVELCKAVWTAGGYVLSDYHPDSDKDFNIEADFYRLAAEHQISYFPKKLMKGLIEEIDHSIFILSETNKHALEGIPPKKIMAHRKAAKPFMDWRNAKEARGQFTWTIALYGTEAMAEEAGLSLPEYWDEIIKACYLDQKNPKTTWKNLYKKLESYRLKLNALVKSGAHKLHVEGPDADLWIQIGKRRAWMCGSGRNIPSFEIFTSPDWRGTEGWIRFNQPLYRYGNLIEGIRLEFKNGKVIKSSAQKNEKVLKEMIATEGADKIGEYSLTDKRFSRITKFMAETLFDENMGGPNGNTHLALGNSYHDCFDGDPSKLNAAQWKELGYNDSSVHTDIISTTPRTVTAHFDDGRKKVIYRNGMFVL